MRPARNNSRAHGDPHDHYHDEANEQLLRKISATNLSIDFRLTVFINGGRGRDGDEVDEEQDEHEVAPEHGRRGNGVSPLSFSGMRHREAGRGAARCT